MIKRTRLKKCTRLKIQLRLKILTAALLLTVLMPGKPAFANHVFYPAGTDYWHVEPLSGPLQFPKQEGNWRMGPDGREYYYKDGVLQTNYLTPDNHYVGADGAIPEHTSLEEYDMVTASRGCRAIIVSKSGHRLEVWRDRQRMYSFVVTCGSSVEGDKVIRGDHRTPVGEFYISRKIPDSFAYLALNLNYPNSEDAARALEAGIISKGTAQSIADTVAKKGYTNGDTVLGGAIQIHGCRIFEGKDQSRGCVEMLSQDMEIVFNIMETGDKVIILP